MADPRAISPQDLEEAVLALLGEVVDAEAGTDVVAGGQVYAVVATGGAVRVLLDPERFPNEASQAALAETVRPLLESVPGVERVVVKPRPRCGTLRAQLPGVRKVLGMPRPAARSTSPWRPAA